MVIDTKTPSGGAILGELHANGWDAPCGFQLQLCQPKDIRYERFELPCPGEVFAVEDLPQGQIELWLRGPGTLRRFLGIHTVVADNFEDLGLVELPPPTKVRFRAKGGEAAQRSVALSSLQAGPGYCEMICLEVPGWIDEAIELFPGPYLLRISTGSTESTPHRFEVPAQAEVIIELDL